MGRKGFKFKTLTSTKAIPPWTHALTLRCFSTWFYSCLIGGARDGAVVKALASHQCGPGSNPGVDAMCGLSLLLVLSFAPRGFSAGTPVFPSP